MGLRRGADIGQVAAHVAIQTVVALVVGLGGLVVLTVFFGGSVGALSALKLASLPRVVATDRVAVEEAVIGVADGSGNRVGRPAQEPGVAPPGCDRPSRARASQLSVTLTPCASAQDAAFHLRQVWPSLTSDRGLRESFHAWVLGRQVEAEIERAWIQGRTLVQVTSSCPSTDRTCDSRNEELASRVGTALPGTVSWPFTDLTGARDMALLPFIVWLVAIAPLRVLAWVRAPRRIPASSLVEPYREPSRKIHRVRILLLLRPLAMLLILVGIFGLIAVSIALSGAEVPPQDWILVLLWLASGVGGVALRRRIRQVARSARRNLIPLATETLRGALGAALRFGAQLTVLWVLMAVGVIAIATMMTSVYTPSALALKLAELEQYPASATGLQRLVANTLLAAMWNPWVLLLLVIAPLLLLALLIDLAGLRLTAASLHETIEASTAPPLLLLRSFEEDNLRVRTILFRWGLLPRIARPMNSARFEEVVAACVSRWRPIIGINPPGTTLSALGVAKETLPHTFWLDRVTELTATAGGLVLFATPDVVRAGFRQELDMIDSTGRHLPIMIFLGPHRVRERIRRFANFANASRLLPTFWELAAVEPPPGTLVIARPAHGGWRYFGADSATDVAYALVTDQALAYSLGTRR